MACCSLWCVCALWNRSRNVKRCSLTCTEEPQNGPVLQDSEKRHVDHAQQSALSTLHSIGHVVAKFEHSCTPKDTGASKRHLHYCIIKLYYDDLVIEAVIQVMNVWPRTGSQVTQPWRPQSRKTPTSWIEAPHKVKNTDASATVVMLQHCLYSYQTLP